MTQGRALDPTGARVDGFGPSDYYDGPGLPSFLVELTMAAVAAVSLGPIMLGLYAVRRGGALID